MNRPTPPGPWPIISPKTAEGKQASKLHAAWVEQFARVERVEADHVQARVAKTAAREAIAAADTAKAAEQAEQDYAAAVAALNGPWTARLEGPIRGCHAAQDALRAFVDEHLAALLTEPELAAAAEQAQDSVVATVEAHEAARTEWRRVADLHANLVRLAEGINARAIPVLGDADALLGGSGSVPIPRVSERALRDRRALRDQADLVG